MMWHRAAWILVLCAGMAHAGKPGKRTMPAKNSFDTEYAAGTDAYNLGHYDEASAHFGHARDLGPGKPGPWRWLGRVARVQKRWKDCITASMQALRLNPDSPLAADVRGDVEACHEGLGRPPYVGSLGPGQGAVYVEAPDGSRITVDGIVKGVTPLAPFPLTAGKHVVAVDQEGKTWSASVDVCPLVVNDVANDHEMSDQSLPSSTPSLTKPE